MSHFFEPYRASGQSKCSNLYANFVVLSVLEWSQIHSTLQTSSLVSDRSYANDAKDNTAHHTAGPEEVLFHQFGFLRDVVPGQFGLQILQEILRSK